MKITLSEHSGFCTGVRKAVIRAVKEINSCDDDILIHGPLIHNPQTIKILENRGMKVIKDYSSIDGKIVAVRSHGIPAKQLWEIKNRAKRLINLTCPKVASVHAIVKKYSDKGDYTILLGDKDHAEVEGIASYASSGYSIISNLDEIDTIPKKSSYIVVAQTTLDISFYYRAVSIIQKKYKKVTIKNTICNATDNRQADLHRAVKKGADAIIVVGGKNSGNTKRLAKIGQTNNIFTKHIETEDELKAKDLEDKKKVFVSAGASTPSWIINNVLERLYCIKYENKPNVIGFLKSTYEFLIRTNLFSSLLSFFMTIAIFRCISTDCDLVMPLITSSLIFIMYSIKNFFQPESVKISNPFKYNIYKKNRLILAIITFMSFAYFAYGIMQYNRIIMGLYLFAFFIGIIYSLPKIKNFITKSLSRPVKMVFGLTSVISSIGWTFVALIIPSIFLMPDLWFFITTSIILSSIVLTRNILLDLINFEGDFLLGINTLPAILGINTTRTLLIVISLLFSLSILYNALYINIFYILFLMNMLYYYWLYKRIKGIHYFYRFQYESLIDLNLLLMSVVIILSSLFTFKIL